MDAEKNEEGKEVRQDEIEALARQWGCPFFHYCPGSQLRNQSDLILSDLLSQLSTLMNRASLLLTPSVGGKERQKKVFKGFKRFHSSKNRSSSGPASAPSPPSSFPKNRLLSIKRSGDRPCPGTRLSSLGLLFLSLFSLTLALTHHGASKMKAGRPVLNECPMYFAVPAPFLLLVCLHSISPCPD